MFQPISFNVIRQALEWHGVPVPKLRMLSFSDYDQDLITAEYRASWAFDDLANAGMGVTMPNGGLFLADFASLVRGCFCEDVCVETVEARASTREVVAVFYVRVSKGLIYLAKVLNANQP